MHSRTRARPARSPLLTLIGKRRSAFASVADAVAYLEPGLQFGTPGTITVYGSRRAFGVLRSRMKNAISAVVAHHYTIANRWMAEQLHGATTSTVRTCVTTCSKGTTSVRRGFSAAV